MLSLMLIALSAPPIAQADAAPREHAVAAKPDKSDRECRRVEKTGSMFPKRVCHSTAEWKKIDDYARRNADTLRHNQRH